jgi:hypothetical protein
MTPVLSWLASFRERFALFPATCDAASHSSDDVIGCSVMGFLVTPQRGR